MSRIWLYTYSFVFIGLTLFSIAPARAAPSFDCSLATSRSETATCADATLSNLDSQYAATYSRLRLLFDRTQNGIQRQQLLQRARDFLKERNACGGSAPCLRDAYNTVLADLQTLSPPAKSFPVPSNVPAQATGNFTWARGDRGYGMITATGNINAPYEVIGVVHVVVTRDQKTSGCGQPAGLPVQEAYEAATAALRESASRSGANGVIHIGYDYRLSSAKHGCDSTKPVFEVYGWGTAIKIL